VQKQAQYRTHTAESGPTAVVIKITIPVEEEENLLNAINTTFTTAV